MIMSGVVIAFPGNGADAKVKKVRPSRGKRLSQITARVDRIAVLLAELDDLAPLTAEVSAALTYALASICEGEEKQASAS